MLSSEKPINIVQVKPKGYAHSSVFDEIAQGLKCAFEEIGAQAQLHSNAIDTSATNILLGAHLINGQAINTLPEDTIVYNFEQLQGNAWFMNSNYRDLLERYQVWDYNPENKPFLENLALKSPVQIVPIGYADTLSCIPVSDQQDIDVLFYGSINKRRENTLKSLSNAGVNLKILNGVYGAERDAYIARSKLVLNLHFYDTQIFELARVSYLLANKKAVVCELGEKTEIDPALKPSLILSPYEDLVSTCLQYLNDDTRRKEAEQRGFDAFRQMKQADYLKPLFN